MKLLFALSLTISIFSVTAQTTSFTDKQAFESFSYSSEKSSRIPSFHSKESTKGSQYLFNDWVSGTAVNKDGQKVEQAGLLFNYDKQNNNLYMTNDKKTVYLISVGDLKSVTLYNGSGPMTLEYNAGVTKTGLVQVLYKDLRGFTLYKLINTKYVPSNYVSTGLTESGHNYDEYVDAPEYVFYKENEGFKKIPVKRKEIKEFFNDNKGAESYLKSHKNDDATDEFMTGLITSMDK